MFSNLNKISRDSVDKNIENDIKNATKQMPKLAAKGLYKYEKIYDPESLPSKGYWSKISGTYNDTSCRYVVDKYREAFPDLRVNSYEPCKVVVNWKFPHNEFGYDPKDLV